MISNGVRFLTLFLCLLFVRSLLTCFQCLPTGNIHHLLITGSRNPNMIERIKRRLRQHRFLSPLMGCPYPAPRWNRSVKRVLRELGPDAQIMDLGSGMHRRSPNVINFEIEPTPLVDVVGDGHALPFADSVFDAVISEAVLEHVSDPMQVVAEMYRVLKPNGFVCAAVPFLQGYHASPHDYQRWTTTGFVKLFSRFHEVESGACAGPTTALHWIFREYVGLVCSFGSLLLAKVVSLLVGWLTFPLVWLDMLLLLHPHSHILASAVYFVGQKK